MRSRSRRSARRAALAAALLLAPLAAPLITSAARAQPAPAAAASGPVEPLAIVSRGGARHAFQVEVARDDAGRSQGLMYRRSMAPDHGMLFDFDRAEPVSMWMKNTYLPLDMLFIRADGTVARIAADTEPLSTRIIPSGEAVPFVLELNAGTAARLGIRPGDRVEHPLVRGR